MRFTQSQLTKILLVKRTQWCRFRKQEGQTKDEVAAHGR